MTDVIAPPIEAAMRAADDGTPGRPQEYSPLTTLQDRQGREWTVNSHRTRAWIQGAMPPFEAMQISRIEELFGELSVKAASPKHRDMFHREPFPGCHNCPPVACRCGRPQCTDYEACYREWAGSETTWREAA